jgi:ribosomal protein L35
MKLKTHKTAKKRVIKTKSGVFRKPAAISHLRTHKSDRDTKKRAVAKADIKKLKRMIPGL